MNRCGAADITCGAVKEVDELLTDPHIRERGMLQDIEHPRAGRLAVLGSPLAAERRAPADRFPEVRGSGSTTSWSTVSCWV